MDFVPAYAVEDGILHYRLKQQLGQRVVPQGLIHLAGVVKGIGIAQVLELHIALQRVQLLPQGDELHRAGESLAQQLGEVEHHLPRLLYLIHLQQEADGAEGIVDEVGVDLGLEKIQLRQMLLPLLPFDRLQKGGDLLHHTVEGLLNTAEFVLSAYVDALVQAALHDPAQAGLELGDGAENLPVGVEKHRQNQGGAQAGGQESAIAYQIQRAEGRRGTHLLHQIPVRPRYAFIQADLPAVNAAGEGRLRRQGVQFLRGIGIDGTNELLVPG